MKKLFENRILRRGCCVLLCAALLAALLLPAAGRAQRRPETPQLHADGHITLLGGGSADSRGGAGSGTGEDSASSGKEGGSEGVSGGSTAERQEDDPSDAPAAPEEKEQNIGAEETGGEQPPEEPVDEPVSPQPQENSGEQSGPEGEPQPDQEDETPSGTDPDNTETGQTEGAETPEDITQEDNTGADGEDETELDLFAVMTWYKYGRKPSTIVCAADDRVGKRVVYSQLEEGVFSYELALGGADEINARIDSISIREGMARPYEADASGEVEMTAPADGGARRYTFTAMATVARYDAGGSRTETEVEFTFVISYEDGLDLSLSMRWLRSGAETELTVAPEGSASRTVRSSELDGALEYSFELQGLSANDAEIVSVVYTSDTGDSGMLDEVGGALEMKTAAGRDKGHYTVFVTAEVYEGGARNARVVEFTVQLIYQDSRELALEFTWYKKSTVAEKLRCEKNERAAVRIKQNQLTSGELMYRLELAGASAKEAEIVSVSLSGPGGAQKLESRGSIPLSVPVGESAARYALQVEALMGRELVRFTVNISYVSDVSVCMRYTTTVDGVETTRQVSCENGRSVSADLIYSDQLQEGVLPFEISIAGDDSGSVTIDRVTLYRSGDGRSMQLARDVGASVYSGSAVLQTDGGRTGENQFAIYASDAEGGEYSFTVNIPYLSRGEKTVIIKTNLKDGQKIENETDVDLTVEAWSQEDDGSVISHIRATGSGTQMTVQLDGKELFYTGASGFVQQYKLYADNPPEGDRNTHVLTIYARDEYGNEGELTVTLIGERSTEGKSIGTAEIYIDMTVLGLGVYGPVRYDVLADEPISYAVAKAVWGYDAGAPFGAAEETFGWDGAYCDYTGTLDVGFYLRTMGDGSGLGSQAKALRASSFDSLGGSEEEILAAIDGYFGAGSAYAALWRCIYRNGIALTGHNAMSVGDQDFTRGSGWLYCLDDSFYPGASMSEYSLQDGQTLTLRYTLAYGWDVGSGQDGYGDAVGYCVTGLDGRLEVEHSYEAVPQSDGTTKFVCSCCGIAEGCPHENTEPRDNGDGTCGVWCFDCGSFTGPLTEHSWEYRFEDGAEEHSKVCTNCRREEWERHDWIRGEDSATCTEPGIVHKFCDICGARAEEETPAKGHSSSGRWDFEPGGPEHYQLCKSCGQEIAGTRGRHDYEYDEVAGDWICSVCNAAHDWDCEGELRLKEGDCQHEAYVCARCGLTLVRTGEFETRHRFENGVCTVCGNRDPEYVEPEPEPEPEPGIEPEPDPESGGQE